MVCLYDFNPLTLMETRAEVIVFLYLCFCLRMNEVVAQTTLVETVTRLGISRQTVSRSLTHLKSLGVVYKHNGLLCVNPEVAWVGDSRVRRTVVDSQILYSRERNP